MNIHEEYGVGQKYECVGIKRISCPRCKCRTEQGAEKKCRPYMDYDGGYECPMDYARTDEKGRFVQEVWKPVKETENG